MVQASIIHVQLPMFLPLGLPDVALLLIGGICAFVLAYLLAFVVRAFCRKVGWLDYPAPRRVHAKPVPRLGGVAIFLAFFIVSLLFYTPGPSNEITIYWLLIAAAALLVIVNAYDDVKGLKWPTKLIVQTIAVIIILGPYNGVFQGVLLFTFNNPFGVEVYRAGLPWYREPTLFLIVQDSAIRFAAIPAILLTWFWTVGMMNTVNWIDGMDGLATGVVGITSLFITVISFMLGQQSIAVLSAIFTGAVLGFLPHNWNPAKMFMGDSGSMFLGLGLAVLSIMGGAKLALALMVLGVPILDVAVVIINRVRRGQSPMHYDKTHLHHRLRATGLSVRKICYVLYGLALMFGLLAASISGVHSAHFYKLVGVGLVVLAMFALIIWIDRRQRQRGIPFKLDDPDPEPEPTGGNGASPDGVLSDGGRKAPYEYEATVILPPPDLPAGHLPAPLPQ